ncbi:hypothetical protein C8J56DRAFT_947051 [Mycena floridula]|nr:hypothetical protein C8J56DRAFT_947051 [Mycena floridula]
MPLVFQATLWPRKGQTVESRFTFWVTALVSLAGVDAEPDIEPKSVESLEHPRQPCINRFVLYHGLFLSTAPDDSIRDRY